MPIQRMPITAAALLALISLTGYSQKTDEIPKAVPSVPICKPSPNSSVMNADPSCISVGSSKPKATDKKALPNMFNQQDDSSMDLGGNVIMDKSEKSELKPPEERVKGAEVEFGIKTK